MGSGGGGQYPLAAAVGAVLEGATFYELGHRAAADTRVKVAFEDLGKRKRAQLARLEALAGAEARSAARAPGIYPMEAVSKVECYVCGYAVATAEMPDQCPSCGAARYSFEKEIAPSKAWEIAGASARKSAALLRDLARRAMPSAKALLEELAGEEDEVAARADRQAAELQT